MRRQRSHRRQRNDRRSFFPPPPLAAVRGDASWHADEHIVLLYDDWPADSQTRDQWPFFESASWDPSWILAAVIGPVGEDVEIQATRGAANARFRVMRYFPTRRKAVVCGLVRM